MAQLEITAEFAQALNWLHSGKSCFLTGKAGTGKSTLIREFLAHTKRNVLVAAPTGIAALNVGGYTLHRLFGFTPSTTLADVLAPSYFPPRAFAAALKQLDVLIIDEASMVRADLLDCVQTALRKFGPHVGELFSGVQIVLVGDLFQLPPVVSTEQEQTYFASVYDSSYFFSAKCFSPQLFPTLQLSKVYRQQGDQTLIDVLNAIREGFASSEVLSTINKRVDRDFEPPLDEFWVTLAPTNKIVKSRNRKALAQLPAPEITVLAEESGEVDHKNLATDALLQLKEGAQVMLLNNDPVGRWVNGTMGKITRIFLPEDQPVSATTVVASDVSLEIETAAGDLHVVDAYTWEVTEPSVAEGQLTHEVVGQFTQLPVKLAWAVTIHKSQGQTLEKVVLDLSGGTRASGQLYVALSRCTSISGLVLHRPIYPKDIKVDPLIRQQLGSAGPTTTKVKVIAGVLVGQGDGFVRPVEIAVAGPAGLEMTSLVNPNRDVGTAGKEYGLTSARLQVAPQLAQCWPFVEDAIAGCALASPTGRALAVLDDELKRTNLVAALTTVAPLPFPAGLVAGAAAAIAVAAQQELANSPLGEQPVYARLEQHPTGYLLTRAGEIVPYGEPEAVAELIGRNLAHAGPWSAETTAAITAFEKTYFVTVPRVAQGEQEPLTAVLQPGLKVCFTGTVFWEEQTYERAHMEFLARRAGLIVKNNVSRTQCDLLIAADPTTQSRKARDARQFGKPIYSAKEFLAWISAAKNGC